MTYHHCIVAIAVEFASRGVGDGDIEERGAGLEREFGDYGEGLVWNETREWVLGLFCESFWRYMSVLSRCNHGECATHGNP